MVSKRGQVTIFIIIGIILVASVLAYFAFRSSVFGDSVPPSLEPVYNSFLSCLEEDVLVGASVLGSQGGYIELPDFEPGSRYMPFGSQLNFLGNPVPYWYYVSGNNIQKEQVPLINNMESQLEDFLEDRVRNCVFDNYYEQGFVITQEEPKANVMIKDDYISVDLDMNFGIEKGEDNAVVGKHRIDVDSKLGMLYNEAKKIYNKEQDSLFLEEYAIDILRLYAPVDGVELTCAPKTWSADEVFLYLQEAIEENTLALKMKGGDYSLGNKEDEYFVLDIESDADVRFITSRNWSNGFEVSPAEGNVLISKPMGNQAGLGILGFCYVPYHFVYDVKYPVLIQVSKNEEIFQFPVAVVLQGNMPRKALEVIGSEIEDSGICDNKNTVVQVNVYDGKLNSVDADVSYECFGSSCDIGRTVEGLMVEEVPQCVNGYVLVQADGFKDAKVLHSSVNEGIVDVIMDKLYDTKVELKLDGINYNKDAIVSFISDDYSRTIVYPETKNVELSAGKYEIQVQIYESSLLNLQKSVSRQCIEIPKQGAGGLIGLTEEECFDIEVPAQVVSEALSGGGSYTAYFLESELESSNVLEISAESLPKPDTIEQLQDNYILFESKYLSVEFK
ncbi:MAG: hypothetical protein ABIA78_00560 [archaeon]